MGGLWLLVPVHELLHVLGCVATGGRVSALELRPIFGGTLLARLLPWVRPASAYAGRLSGFAPAGDLSYLLTSAAPHLVLAPAGAWLARRAALCGRPLLFGIGTATALQPLASLGGDAYEVGAIPVTAVARAAGWPQALLLRGDDVAEVARRAAALATPAAWAVAAVAWLVGLSVFAALLVASGGLAPRPARATGVPRPPA